MIFLIMYSGFRFVNLAELVGVPKASCFQNVFTKNSSAPFIFTFSKKKTN